MIFIRTRHLIIYLVLIGGGGITGSLLGYFMLMENENKFLAERYLLFTLVAVMLTVVFIIRMLIFNRQVIGKFDKVMNLSRNTGIVPLERLLYFGKMGRKMVALYNELDSLGKMKTNRIQQQNLMLGMLMEFIEIPLLIIDLTSEIRYVSRGFVERHKITAAGVIEKPLYDFIPELDFRKVLLEANHTKNPVEIEKEKIIFYPVLSTTNEVAYFITVFGRQDIFNFIRENGDKQKTSWLKPNTRPVKGLFNFLRRKEE